MTVFIRRLYIPVTIAALTLVTSAVQAAQVQVGFSLQGSAEALVLDVIQKAEHQTLLMGYSFTSPDVAKMYTEHWQSRWDKGQAYQPGY
ncbi:hypothetical protein V2K54_25650 [Pseudomonas alliivorans]|nr:hypothetical protein [Pseudomonas alliivorans]